MIIQATPTNKKGATACGVFVYSFVFLSVKFNDFNTVLKCIHFKGFLKLNIKMFATVFVHALSRFKSTRLQTRNLKFNTALGCASCSHVKFLVSCLYSRACKSR